MRRHTRERQRSDQPRLDEAEPAGGRVNLTYLPTGVTADANDVWVTVRHQ